MRQRITISVLLAVVIVLPFIFHRKDTAFIQHPEERVVVITPHNEAIRTEFARGFRDWYLAKTGKVVDVDWRTLGGSQEVVRYVNGRFFNAFKLYWTRDLGRPWKEKYVEYFDNPAIIPADRPENDDEGQSVRRAFLASDIGIGLDLVFGGGEIEVLDQANKGQLVPSGILEHKPEFFTDDSIPQSFGGIDCWDPRGRWVGTSHSGFGIIFNQDVLDLLGIEKAPKAWADLAEGVYFGEVALADPTISSSSNRGFEMIIQQQMQNELRRLLAEGLVFGAQAEAQAVASGWMKGMQLIQKISANARYFTDFSTKPVLDVSAGDCAVGMAIDFYGLFQEENLRNRSGSQRFNFVMPKGGSVVSPDPIAMFRGAPNPGLALAFIEYILSIDGQKLWDYRVGTPGGPKQYALSRAPIRKELFEGEYLKYRGNPTLNLYRDVAGFTYHPEWTSFLFKELRFSIKAAFVDSHKELVDAWSSIIRARQEGRDEAAKLGLKLMESLGDISYEAVKGSIKDTLNSGDPLDEIKFQSSLVRKFRQQYREVKRLAEAGMDS